jgi:tetratricopeptide (TPR) repeat protein
VNYRLAIEQNPNYYEALINVGYLFIQIQKYNEAIFYFEKAIAFNPNNKEILNAISHAKINLGFYKDAIPYLLRSKLVESNQREVELNLGYVFLKLGDVAQSIIFFSTVLQKDPNDFEALNNRANSYYLQKKYPEALDDISKAIEINSEYSIAYFTYGNILSDLTDFDKALVQFDRCISIEPGYFEAYGGKALVYYKKKEYEKALELFNFCLAKLPANAEILNNRGANYKELRKFDLALSDYEKAIDINPDYFEAKLNRAELYDLLKLFGKAEIEFLTLLEKYSEKPNLKVNASMHFLNLKKFKHGWPLYESRADLFDPKAKFSEFYFACKNKVSLWSKNNSYNNILIITEQGLGDQILHLSLLSEFIKTNLCSEISILLDFRLTKLFERGFSNFPNLTFIPTKKNAPLIDINLNLYDSYILSGSLMQFFRNEIKDFKHQNFLISDANGRINLKNKFTKCKRRVCGISWLSKNIDTAKDKSLPQSSVLEIISMKNFHFIDLNYLEIDPKLLNIILENQLNFEKLQNVDNLEDIDGLASIIDACDIIVTISNVTAHIAGALGKKTCLLMPYSAGKNWYWHEDDDFSLWYPSIRIYRQNKDNDWTAPLFQLKDDLHRFLNE